MTQSGTETKRILLIEDNPNDISLIDHIIKKHRTSTNLNIITNGAEALFELEKMGKGGYPLPHLIIIDLNLPNANGFEFITKIKQNNKLKLIPIIVFTASDSEKDIETAYGNNASCFITKPTEFEELKRTVNALIDFWIDIVKFPLI